jgi:hypothetical protein
MRTVILVGGQGSGKSLVAPDLAAREGCVQVVDEWWPGKPLTPGALHVTHELGSDLPPGIKVIHWPELVGSEGAPALPQEVRDAA